MKKLVIICLVILFWACNQTKKDTLNVKASPERTIADGEHMDWVIGSWQRLNEEAGKETFENWKKTNPTTYTGIGFTLQNGDTIQQELIQLMKAKDSWNLKVKTPNEIDWTTFKGIDYSTTHFSCENTEIEFPNQIKYWINLDTLHAMVSGSGMEIPFKFKKLK
ncbi:hypothetical protein FNB79_00930 [Formosa sediminum]|uniref:Uncharacterized protein n=1 Tax=Formosa sediminum TaxID=2594004 RepID=A0A516GM53_9FLAO|nr:hypothetical protein [Formosa sediminum]QDO92602.1 hypothetical protein FNB79_00930 [Formosa sediminum]